MKNLFLVLLISSAFYNTTFSQSGEFCVYGYPHPWGCNNNHWIVDTANNQNCVWQYGITSKPSFLQTYPCLITDTIHSYPPNNYSSLSLIITTVTYPPETGVAIGIIRISIQHSMEADTLSDGGYIEYSQDNGLTWVNVADIYNGEPYFSELYNEKRGFSGNFFNQSNSFDFGPSNCNDTVLLRIVFISDSINTNKGGWQISGLTVFVWTTTNSEIELTEKLTILSNPLVNNTIYTIQDKYNNSKVFIHNLAGKKIEDFEITDNHLRIPCTINPGFYVVSIQNANAIYRQKVLILNE